MRRNEQAAEQLRRLYVAAEGEYRCQAAILLGLVIADLVAELPDDDGRLPGLVEEGLLRLEEGMAGAEAAAPTAAVSRAREALSSRLRPPTAPIGFSISAEMLATLERFDPATLRSAIEAMRLRMPPEGHPDRIGIQIVLDLIDADVLDGFQSGRWKPEYDPMLARLDRLEADVVAAGGTLDASELALLRRISADLHQVRDLSTMNKLRSGEPSEVGNTPASEPVPDEPHWLSGAEVQQWRRVAPGLKMMASLLPDDPASPPIQAIAAANDLVNALVTHTWTIEHEEALANLQRLVGGDELDRAQAVCVRAAVDLVRVVRYETAAQSPNPGDWPDPAELTKVVRELEDILGEVAEAGPWSDILAGQLRVLAARLLLRLAGETGGDGASDMLARAREYLAKVPPAALLDSQQLAADIASIERLSAGDSGEDDEAPLEGTGDAGDFIVVKTYDSGRLLDNIEHARRTMSPADLAAAIEELRRVSRSLDAGHPERGIVLTRLADLLSVLAVATRSPKHLVEALNAAIEALRVVPRRELHDVGSVLLGLLGIMVAGDQRVGPFEPAEVALENALARADPDDARLRLILTLGLGGASSMRARAAGEEDLRRRARKAFLTVEQLLGEPEPADDWLELASMLLCFTVGQATLGGDSEAAELAMRAADRMERLFINHPELAERMSGPLLLPGFGIVAPASLGEDGHGVLATIRVLKDLSSFMGGSSQFSEMLRVNRPAERFGVVDPSFVPPSAEDTRRLAVRGLDQARAALGTAPPEVEALRAACSDLRLAAGGGLDDNSLQQQVNGALGRCLAALYPLGNRNIRTLAEAIEHLDQALSGAEHTYPTVDRVDLMDVLARCYREAAERGLRGQVRSDAERTARAALRELARCVLVADTTEGALDTAARANKIVARAVGWCLADDRPGAAAEIAEAGRSLVLASVVLSGRVEAVLRGAGEDDAADAWRGADREGRLVSLNRVWQTRFGQSLLNTPTAEDISAMLVLTPGVDGLVYLVPQATGGSPAHAVVFRASLGGQYEMVELPGMQTGAGTPLGDYLDAFGAALDRHDPARRSTNGFRGTPAGQRWAAALDRLGAWTHEHLIGPLVEHTCGWSLGRPPHLALVPLGQLAVIPFAAAWTVDADRLGGRRYAVHDLVLSHAVSARLLGEAARRAHQPLTERVVLVPDPTGKFPYARATARALNQRLYPNAEVYERQVSSERILAALPGRDRQGASLFHLSTHATTEPTPRLWAGDGWLALDQILEQARDRAPDRPGGLVITNACLTDSTHSHFDESVTLATALLTAGATGVIGTRWPVDDDTTAIFTYHLHHRLALGTPPAEALRQAQLDLIDPDPRPRPGLHHHLATVQPARLAHPASWAAFTYHGT